MFLSAYTILISITPSFSFEINIFFAKAKLNFEAIIFLVFYDDKLIKNIL